MITKLFFFICVFGVSFGDDGYVINSKKFPSSFLFGAASSAYQIEGGWNADGKGENVWDNFTHIQPSVIADKSNGDVACDSYHNYKRDVAMLKNLGVKHYRFSFSWARILPNGTPTLINAAGVRYYKNLIKELKQNNIEPLITLFHWDLPQVLQLYGGFLNVSIVNWFSDYVRVCFDTFGEDIKYWFTINEGFIMCSLGYGTGELAPGIKSPAQGEYLCAHNLIKAHAAAWHVYNNEFRKKQKGTVSIVNVISWSGPANNSTENITASETAMEFNLGWFADPIYHGDYPDIMKIRIANRSYHEGFKESRLPKFTEKEKKMIKGTSDFFCINSYFSSVVKAIPEPAFSLPPSFEKDMGVEVVDSSFTEKNGAWGMPPLLKWIQARYGNPDIIITENGYGNKGGLQDDDRIHIIKSFLSRIRDAMDEGVKVFGYTVWSLMDSFEWNSGYKNKYGIYQVDFGSKNRTRTPKKSASWYKNVIKTYCLVDKCMK